MITFKNGRKLDGNADYYGLSDDLEVSTGYDSTMYCAGVDENDDHGPSWTLTKGEQIELATIMIERWTRFLSRAEALPEEA